MTAEVQVDTVYVCIGLSTDDTRWYC